MRSIQFLVLLILVLSKGFAQNGPDVVLPDTTKPLYRKVMIIPFEENMYLCGVQTHLAQHSRKTHNEIVQFFRESTVLELQNQFLYRYNTVSLLHYNDTTKDLIKAYDAISYKFEIAPIENEEESSKKTIDKARNLFQKKTVKSSKFERGSTSDGQIVSLKNTDQKFAAIVVRKKENIAFLSKKYNADLFVYVTEFDIENDMSNPSAFVNGEYKRLLKLHFSMVNKEGEVIEKGLVSIPFPNNQNSIYKIRTLYLPLAAKKMMDKLPYTPKPMVDDKKGKAVNASDKVKR
tara:strand:+ start:945 stop:1814 length:870 start_codon:yes stop_codon:yes gene_type:complete